MDKAIMPWERQEGETVKQFEAFCVYRDMGKDRTLQKVADELSKSGALIRRWSANNNWLDRVAAWEDEQDRLIRIELTRNIGAMRKRHADIARSMLVKASKALLKIPDSEIKAGDISRMVDVAAKLERISRGDVGEVVEERQGEAVADPVQFYIPDNGRDSEETT